MIGVYFWGLLIEPTLNLKLLAITFYITTIWVIALIDIRIVSDLLVRDDLCERHLQYLSHILAVHKHLTKITEEEGIVFITG